jgi:hypothetical protein
MDQVGNRRRCVPVVDAAARGRRSGSASDGTLCARSNTFMVDEDANERDPLTRQMTVVSIHHDC